MAREYLYTLENQAKAVSACAKCHDLESYQVNHLQMLLGLTERLEALAEEVEGVREALIHLQPR